MRLLNWLMLLMNFLKDIVASTFFKTHAEDQSSNQSKNESVNQSHSSELINSEECRIIEQHVQRDSPANQSLSQIEIASRDHSTYATWTDLIDRMHSRYSDAHEAEEMCRELRTLCLDPFLPHHLINDMQFAGLLQFITSNLHENFLVLTEALIHLLAFHDFRADDGSDSRTYLRECSLLTWRFYATPDLMPGRAILLCAFMDEIITPNLSDLDEDQPYQFPYFYFDGRPFDCLSPMLKRMSTLKSLTINHELNDEEAQQLTDALKHVSELRKIKLHRGNDLSKEALEGVLGTLRDHAPLISHAHILGEKCHSDTLVKAISQLQSITDLALGPLDEAGCVELEHLKQLTHLVDLKLIDCQYGETWPIIASVLPQLKSLKRLSLAKSNIGNSAFFDAIGLCIGIQQLSINNCSSVSQEDQSTDQSIDQSISTSEANSLINSIKKLTSLQRFTLCHSGLDFDVSSLIGVITTLTELRLNDVTIDGEKLIQLLEMCPSFGVLVLRCCVVNNMIELFINLAKCVQLREVRLDGSPINPDEMACLVEHLPLWSSLRVLSLSDTGDDNMSDPVQDQMICNVTSVPHLQYLAMSNAFLSPFFLQDSSSLNNLKELHSLQLVNAGFERAFCVGASDGLACLSQLTLLDLSDQALTFDGLRSLERGISELFQLRQLILKNCGLNKQAGKIISRILYHIPHLTRLDLCDNPLQNFGLDKLSKALEDEKAQVLFDLLLMGCNIGDKGVMSLMDALVKAGVFPLVHLRNNPQITQRMSNIANQLRRGRVDTDHS